MREYFWKDYYVDGKVVNFHKTFDYSSLEIHVTGDGVSKCTITIKQRDEEMKLELTKGDCCYLNGLNTGKVLWYDDIDFSMEYDEFGGIMLVLKDGDYVSMRMDGVITSFYNVPYKELQPYISSYVNRARAQYRPDWYNTLR